MSRPLRIGLASLACLGILAACSGEDPSRKDSNTASVQGAITLSDWPALPLCTVLNRGGVYYIQSQKKVVYCDGRKYNPIELTGYNGSDGINWIVLVADAAAACPTGGALVMGGPDANNDKVIDAVVFTQAICDGQPGPQGEDGERGDTGANGTAGASGAKGEAGEPGINGTSSPGNSVAIRQTPFGPTVRCSFGGTRIETGVDTNRDGVLQDNEVTAMTEVCSADGCAGAPCQNGSTCSRTQTAPGYKCTCVRGFAGQNCGAGVLDLSVGPSQTCIVNGNHAIRCWGGSSSAAAAPAGEDFAKVAVGLTFVCGVRLDDTVECTTSLIPNPQFPILPTPPGRFKAVAPSKNASGVCGVRMDGTLACWGRSSAEILAETPAGTFQSVAFGTHPCAIREDGTLACWPSTYPSAPSGIYKQLTSVNSAMCGLKPDGVAACWPAGTQYTDPSSHTLSGKQSIAGGSNVFCGLGANGRVSCDPYYNSQYGQLEDQLTTLSADATTYCGIATTGGVSCRGPNSARVVVPPGL